MNTQAIQKSNAKSNQKTRSWIVIACAAVLAIVSPDSVSAQELDNSQIQVLNSARTQLKKLVTNFNLAQQSTGKTRPKGSRARLAKLRLDQAKASIPNIQSFMKDLPSSNEHVKQTASDLANAIASIEKFENWLDGKDDPSSGAATGETKKQAGTSKPKMVERPSSKKSGSSATIKLDYRQVESLKNAQFHLRTVEGVVASLLNTQTGIDKIADKKTVNYRVVRKAIETLAEGNRKAKFCQENLDKVPSNGDGVADVTNRLANANDSLRAIGEKMVPLNEMLTQLVDPANYPNLNGDLKRIRELSQMFGDPMVFLSDLPRAKAAWLQMEPASEEAVRLAGAYKNLIQQQTGEGTSIASATKFLLDKQKAFRQAAEQQRVALPKKIEEGFAKIRDMASTAVQNKKPAFFNGGIPQQMGFVVEKLDLLAALDEDSAKSLSEKMNQLNVELKNQQKSLSKMIIEQNTVPADRFTGADRDKAIEVAIDGWKHQQADFELLATRVPAEAWARETRWEYHNGTWYFVDRSKLAVFLLIQDKEDPNLAIKRPVTVIKDHQKGDAMIGTPMYSGDDELLPNAYLLKSKVK